MLVLIVWRRRVLKLLGFSVVVVAVEKVEELGGCCGGNGDWVWLDLGLVGLSKGVLWHHRDDFMTLLFHADISKPS